jgi:peptidoglycan/xylan/chitin deacetylase (PgdA/CDA1 family)
MIYSSLAKKILEVCDNGIAEMCGWLAPDSPMLLIFTFHSLFTSTEEIASGILDPQQGITTGMFRQFVGDFQKHGYRFVSPQQIVDGLAAETNYVLITFDDGYYNNIRALSVLEEFQVPAVFCISTNYVETGKAFWWDILYREAKKREWTSSHTGRLRAAFKLMRTSDAEKKIRSDFGDASLQPVADLDRPLTPTELSDLANHPLAHIGNHTSDHAILTNYSHTEIHAQISRAQESICQLTGKTPELIAYPNGNVSSEVCQSARDAGLLLGVTVQPGRNRIVDTCSFPQVMALKRFTLWADRKVEAQCRIARSRFSVQTAMSSLRARSRVAFA